VHHIGVFVAVLVARVANEGQDRLPLAAALLALLAFG
jgi:hypothetical protein